MRKLIPFAAATLLLAACSKKSNTTSNIMSARVNGAQWTADSGYAGFRGDFILLYVIEGYQAASGSTPASTIHWNLFSSPENGDIDNINSAGHVTAVYIVNSVSHNAASGHITIASISTTAVEGSFELTTVDNIAITNGSFNLPVSANLQLKATK